MSFVSRLRDACVEALLASAVVGLVEGVRLFDVAGSALAALIVAALATAGALVVAVVLRATLAALARLGVAKEWTSAISAGGARRVSAVWRAALVLVSVSVTGVAGFEWLAFAHEAFRFKDAGPVALSSIAVILAVAIALGLGALVLDRRVRPRLPVTLLDTPRTWLAVRLAGLLALLALPPLAVSHAVPAIDAAYAVTLSVLATALAVVSVTNAAARRPVQLAAIAIVLATLGGTYALRGSPEAHGAMVERGIASAPVASALRHAADADRDGYPSAAAGGADCDDGNPARSPGGQDIPGNGVDENCTGTDADRMTFGLRTQTRPVPPPPIRSNIVLISIDALRADHLGAYGYPRKTSPAIDALAARGVRFDAAYTPCPSTRCAVPALHTGRYPSTLGALDRGTIPTLAGVLRAAGWDTAAITCCDRFAIARGEVAGFEHIDASADAIRRTRDGQSNADIVVDRALDWVRTRNPSKPYFAWIHLYEPHFPYAAPAGNTFGESDIDRYDAEIAYADAQLARLVTELDPKTIIVVTSDHGEEFGEHGIRFHARSLYNSVVHVPLVIRVPAVAPRTVSTPVSLVDVMPTLLDLAGIEGPAGMNGRTLGPALHGGLAKERPILLELAHDRQITRDMAGLVSAPYKVIWDRQANAWSLYKLDDTGDTTNLRDDAALPEMQRLLLETLDRETGVIPEARQ